MQIDSGGREESTENHGVMHKQTGHLHGRDIYKPCKLFQKKKGKRVACGRACFSDAFDKRFILRSRVFFFLSVAKRCKINE